MTGPQGGELYGEIITLYVNGRGWVTAWSEVFTPAGGIVKRCFERRATDAEVFTAQMRPHECIGRENQTA